MLVGSDYSCLLPQIVKTVGNLQLLKNVFGYCVRGSLISLESCMGGTNKFDVEITHLNYHCKMEDLYVAPMNKIERDTK